MSQTVKCLSAMQETQVLSLGLEDPLEKEMAAHSRTLACKIPWMEEPSRLLSMGSQRVGHDRVTSPFFYCSPPAPLSKGFSRQEYWSGLSCPPSGNLTNPGIESMSLCMHSCMHAKLL